MKHIGSVIIVVFSNSFLFRFSVYSTVVNLKFFFILLFVLGSISRSILQDK